MPSSKDDEMITKGSSDSEPEEVEMEEEEEEVEEEEEEEEPEEIEENGGDGDGEVVEEVEEEEEEPEEEEPEEEEEEEEEEGEEEEEEQVEEEEEEEADDDDEEEKPAYSADKEEDRNDYSKEEGHEEDLKLEKLKPIPTSVTRDGKDSGSPSIEQPETQGKKVSNVSYGGSKHISRKNLDSSRDKEFAKSLADDKVIGSKLEKQATHAEKSKSSGFNAKEMTAEPPKIESSGNKLSNDFLPFGEETKQIDRDSREDTKLRASSSITPQIRPRSLTPGVEFEDRNKKPAVLCDFFARGWCIKGSSCRFLHQKDGVASTSKCAKADEIKEDAGLRQDGNEPHSLDKNRSSSPVVEGITRSISGEIARGYPMCRNNLAPEHRPISSGSVISSSIFGNSSHSFAFDKGISPLHHTFSWPGTSPSKGASPLGSMKVLDGERGYYASASFLPTSSSSPFYLRLERDNLSMRSNLGDPLTYSGNLAQYTSYIWEPSKSFRPSFKLPSIIISSPGTQYDPLRDSIEPPNGADHIYPSSFSKGISIHMTSNQHVNGDSVLKHPESTTSNKNMNNHGLGSYKTSVEATGSLMVEEQNQSVVAKEEKPIKRHVKSSSTAKEVDHKAPLTHQVDLDHNPAHQAGGVKHNRESKTLKLFRASLVDFVKELVKPSWREGHLSKDAHNMVVKRAVEKVLSTLQPHQIPTSTELTDQYLSASQPKIEKLVEGYVGKYANAKS